MIKHFLILGLFVILGFAGFLAYHLGALKPVEIQEVTEGPLYFIGKPHVGPYHKIVEKIEVVEKWIFSQKKDCTFSFGMFLDNPEKTEEARLQSFGGCFSQNPWNFSSYPEGFSIKEWPLQKYVKATFSGSPSIGPLKVYPRIQEYLAKKGWKMETPSLEVYEIHDRQKNNSMTTTYYFPITISKESPQ